MIFDFYENERLSSIDFDFNIDIVDDIKHFEKTMIVKNKKGYPEYFLRFGSGDNSYSVEFDDGIISKPWRKFIIDCFKYEDLDYIKLVAVGDLNNKWYPKGGWEKVNLKNYMLVLGNLGIPNVMINRNFAGGVKRINK